MAPVSQKGNDMSTELSKFGAPDVEAARGGAAPASPAKAPGGNERLLVVVLLALAGLAAVVGFFHVRREAAPPDMPGVGPEMPGVTPEGPASPESSDFVSKVLAAAAQGATAAAVAALLSAITEPIVNRLLVKRMTFAQAYNEIYVKDMAKFFLTTFPTNMLKFPVFEMINIMLSFTSLSGSLRGITNGFLFCTIMLPVTNYRFRKSMNLEIKPSLLYQAYVPTVCRDIAYGWARGLVGGYVNRVLGAGPAAFGITIWCACIISSPGNEWRGYTLQPANKKLPFKEYFKPVNYARSTGIGATIMAIALAMGMLVTPYVESLVSLLASLVR